MVFPYGDQTGVTNSNTTNAAPTPADVPGQGEVALSDLLAAHANDGCGDCICSEYVLDVPFAEHVAAALHDWLAEQIAAAEQRGREDNADHGQCYVSGSNALAGRDAEVARAERERVLGEVEARIEDYAERRAATAYQPWFNPLSGAFAGGRVEGLDKAINIVRDLRNGATS